MKTPEELDIETNTIKHIEELAEHFKLHVIEESMRLLKTGAIDISNYNPEEYALTKVLLSAAIFQNYKCYQPLDGKPLEDYKNLRHF